MVNKLGEIIKKPFNWFLNTTIKKKLIIIAIFLGIVVLTYWQISSKKNKGYIFGKVEKQSITEIITESGTVTATSKVSVYSPTNGLIKDVYVTNGNVVTENQKLFSVKSTATQQEKASALATYQAAQTALEQSENARRSTLTTVDRVYDDLQGHAADESYSQRETRTTAEAANDNAYAALLSARAQLASAKIAYLATQNSTVTAPCDGEISNVSIVKGSNVSAYNILVPTSPVLIISSSGPTEVSAAIGESDINKIKVGQEVTVKLDAIPNKSYEGLIKRLDTYGTVIQGVVKFNIYIEITNADSQIKPGMTADVDIVTNKLTAALAVANSAIKPYQKGRAVRRLKANGEIEYLPVKIGIRGKEYTQIVEGLEEGQEIIISLASENKPKKNSLF
jgi:HlyD family secretion protein